MSDALVRLIHNTNVLLLLAIFVSPSTVCLDQEMLCNFIKYIEDCIIEGDIYARKNH
jgi:hypothetical protein